MKNSTFYLGLMFAVSVALQTISTGAKSVVVQVVMWAVGMLWFIVPVLVLLVFDMLDERKTKSTIHTRMEGGRTGG